MQIFPIINQVGPLPLDGKFNAPLDGPGLLVVTGSAYSTLPNSMMTLSVLLDGAQVGTLQMFSNGNETHRSFPTLFVNVNLTYGAHDVTVNLSGPGAVSDLNDPFYVGIMY